MAGGRPDPIRVEARAGIELAQLQAAPVFYGYGIPRGDGRPVVVLPGLFGNDIYLTPMRRWLRRIGYRPVASSLRINAGCPNRLREQVERPIDRELERHGGPIALIGHSRGGMLAWAIASRLQDRVSHLALLGSPAPAVVAMFREEGVMSPRSVAHSSVARAGAQATKLFDPDCNVPHCGCPYPDDIRRPLSPATKVISFTSRDDPIVRPAASQVWNGENVEVSGSHSGLAHNVAVYPRLARFLAG
ncbi:MAG: esterase/lipase family protein [Desertimonas sp.]